MGNRPLKDVTHKQLCEVAATWLQNRCNVALTGIASSYAEKPDAIGWSTSGKNYGCTVVECKVSVSDFLANKQKKHGNKLGNYRYFLVPENLITWATLQEHYPGNGLLYYWRGKCKMIGHPVRRDETDYDTEVRLLQFALVHVREQLLYAGWSVDMNSLTKSPMGNGCRTDIVTSKVLARFNEYRLHSSLCSYGESFPLGLA